MVDDGKRGSTMREVLGQGCGNLVSGLTGGIGGCALLGQSIINVQSGGSVSRFSGMSVSLFLAAGIVACGTIAWFCPNRLIGGSYASCLSVDLFMVVSASDAQNPLIGRSRDCSCLHRHRPEGPCLRRRRRIGRKLIGVRVEAVNNLDCLQYVGRRQEALPIERAALLRLDSPV